MAGVVAGIVYGDFRGIQNEDAPPRIGTVYRVIVLLGMFILAAMLIAIPDEISICDTGTEGVQLELRRSRIFGRARALVLVEVESDSIPGLPSIVDIGSKDEAEILGLALAKPGGPPIDVFSREFAKEHCSLRR